MGDLAVILMQAAAAGSGAIGLWIGLARGLRKRGLGRWRAAPLCLSLALCAVGYGLFWLAFFASPALAVKMHAIRLMLSHVLGEGLPWLVGGGFALAALPLLPLARRRLSRP